MQASGAQQPSYAQMQTWLRRSLLRFDCPDAHALGEYQLDLAAPEPRARIAAHLVDCQACHAELDTLRQYLAEPIAAPETLFERARRLVATLLTPAPGLAYGGLRGSAPPVRVYEVEDVTVTVGPAQGAGSLIGLVMVTSIPPENLIGRQVRLVSREGAVHQAALDEIGNFEFAAVGAGPYALEVDLPDTLIIIEELHLG